MLMKMLRHRLTTLHVTMRTSPSSPTASLPPRASRTSRAIAARALGASNGARDAGRARNAAREVDRPRLRRRIRPVLTAASAADDMSADIERIQTLVGWCVERGARGSGLTVAIEGANEGGRGLEATRDVAAGECVLATPLTLGIVDDEDGHPESARGVMRDAPWGVRLACRVLQETKLGEASEYAPYVATLPNRVATSPIHYDAQTIAEVQYPPAMSEIREMQDACRSWHEKLREKAPEALGDAFFDYEAFANAVGVVHSRTYGVAGDDASGEQSATVGYFRALLPLADMLNHGGDVVVGRERDQVTGATTDLQIRATDNIAWSVLGDDGVIHFAATRDLVDGEEALMSYGERSNDHFLIYYGFTPENNPHDDVVLFSNFEHAMVWHSVAHPELWEGDDGAIREKAANAAYDSVTKALEADGSPDAKLAAAEPRMKILSAGRVDARLLSAYASMFAGTEASGATDGPIQGDELKFAQADIAARCEQLLAGMPTTLADDVSALQTCTDDAQRVRLQYRISKKSILAETIDMFSLSK